MRVLLGLLLAIALLAAGAWLGKTYFETPPILVTSLVANMQDDTVIEHERDMVTWYRTCPKRIHWHDFSPEILVIFPATVRYELSLENLSLPEFIDGEWVVEAGPITADKPIIDTNRQTSLANGKPLTDENEYISREMQRMTPIASYLSLQQLQTEQSTIRKRMAMQIEKLIQSMQRASQLANSTNNLSSSMPGNYPVKIIWKEEQQRDYLQKAFSQIDAQPPFGIRGCKGDEWLQVNGNNTGIALIPPEQKTTPKKTTKSKQESRYIVH